MHITATKSRPSKHTFRMVAIVIAGILLGVIIWNWFEQRIKQIEVHSTTGYAG